jgi:hypothetical protein
MRVQSYTQGEENGFQHFTLSLILSNLTLRERKMNFTIPHSLKSYPTIVLMKVRNVEVHFPLPECKVG